MEKKRLQIKSLLPVLLCAWAFFLCACEAPLPQMQLAYSDTDGYVLRANGGLYTEQPAPGWSFFSDAAGKELVECGEVPKRFDTSAERYNTGARAWKVYRYAGDAELRFLLLEVEQGFPAKLLPGMHPKRIELCRADADFPAYTAEAVDGLLVDIVLRKPQMDSGGHVNIHMERISDMPNTDKALIQSLFDVLASPAMPIYESAESVAGCLYMLHEGLEGCAGTHMVCCRDGAYYLQQSAGENLYCPLPDALWQACIGEEYTLAARP